MLPPPHCILGPPMTTGANDVWVFRIVHQDTGKPAPGVPVTVLDRAGNAEGHWVSDADGTVAIPRRETLKLRIRVGLRSGPDRARDRDAGRGTHAARRADAAAAHHRIDRPRG